MRYAAFTAATLLFVLIALRLGSKPSLEKMSLVELQEYSRVHPGDVDAARLTGSALIAAKRPAEAVSPLLHAHRLAPQRADIYDVYCLSLILSGRQPEAQQELETLLQQHPDDEPALRNLGQLYLLHGDANRARPLLEKASASRPDDAAAARALQFARKASISGINSSAPRPQDRTQPVAADPAGRESATALLQEAGNYLSQRQYDLAVQSCDRVLTADPNNQPARQLRRRVMAAIAASLVASPPLQTNSGKTTTFPAVATDSKATGR